MLAPCNDLIKIVAICDSGAGQKQQHFSQRIRNPPWLPAIRKLRELFEENGDPRPRHLLEKNCIHVRAPSRISAPRQSRSCRQDKIPSFRGVNLSAEPCAKTRPALTGPARDGCEIRRSGWKNARGAGRTKEWPQREQENWHFQTAGFK